MYTYALPCMYTGQRLRCCTFGELNLDSRHSSLGEALHWGTWLTKKLAESSPSLDRQDHRGFSVHNQANWKVNIWMYGLSFLLGNAGWSCIECWLRNRNVHISLRWPASSSIASNELRGWNIAPGVEIGQALRSMLILGISLLHRDQAFAYGFNIYKMLSFPR